jgi:transcriptional regulator with XRE-family HTH domain
MLIVNRQTDTYSSHACRMMEKLGSLAARVRSARKAKNWSQETLRDEAKVGQSTISEIESGTTQDPGQATLIRLADALGVRYQWLATGDGPRELGGPDNLALESDEDVTFWKNYKNGSPAWQAILRRFAALPPDEQGRIAGDVIDFLPRGQQSVVPPVRGGLNPSTTSPHSERKRRRRVK